MKIEYTYQTATGPITIEVGQTDYDILIDLDRREYNANHRETRRHASLDAYNADDNLIASTVDITSEYEAKEQRAHIDSALGKLRPEQERLIRAVFFEGVSPGEIARRGGVDKSAISHRLSRAYRQLRKFL
jgi:RNA polymerase sigma factor (sigma-70 family)